MGPVTSHPELHQTVILEAGCALACVVMDTIFRMASSPQRALLSLQADNLQGRLGRVLSSSVSYGNVPSSRRTRLSSGGLCVTSYRRTSYYTRDHSIRALSDWAAVLVHQLDTVGLITKRPEWTSTLVFHRMRSLREAYESGVSDADICFPRNLHAILSHCWLCRLSRWAAASPSESGRRFQRIRGH